MEWKLFSLKQKKLITIDVVNFGSMHVHCIDGLECCTKSIREHE